LADAEVTGQFQCLNCVEKFPTIDEMIEHHDTGHTTITMSEPWEGNAPLRLSAPPQTPEGFRSNVTWPGKTD
jgi:hypothetical protein